ncbi:MAG: hypothetical protein JWQ27_2682 [Ferruginibacter sp.]|nr:hypothetical protein [Ferruginibacter sp.]
MTWFEVCRDIGVFGVAAFIIQRIIENSSTRNLEKYKQELDFTIRSYQLTLDTDLERYKSDLNLHLTRQTTLHDKRLTIIDEMYKKLVTLDSGMRAMTGMHLVYDDAEKESKQRVDTAQEAFTEYNNYFLYNKLYFNKQISDLLENIRKEYLSANFDFFEPKRLQSFTGGRPSREGYRAAVETSQAAAKRIQNDIPKILEQLEEEFRKLLGVT